VQADISEDTEAPPPAPQAAPPSEPGRRIAALLLGTALVLALTLLFLWKAGTRGTAKASRPERTAPAATPGLSVAGRWQTEFSKTLPGPPPSPAAKNVFIETDSEGAILAAGVLLTDPARGGVGAGYRIVPDGRRRMDEIAGLLAKDPQGASLPIDFIPYPAWVPKRARVWRALEGQSRKSANIRYLLLESVEDDYLVQAGINPSGFLSYAFFSPSYASGRGVDSLSGVIHPESGSSLYRFHNLVWDLSGEADFLSMEVHATLSGPEGMPDRLTLKR
jgi:hypothetical protein